MFAGPSPNSLCSGESARQGIGGLTVPFFHIRDAVDGPSAERRRELAEKANEGSLTAEKYG